MIQGKTYAPGQAPSDPNQQGLNMGAGSTYAANRPPTPGTYNSGTGNQLAATPVGQGGKRMIADMQHPTMGQTDGNVQPAQQLAQAPAAAPAAAPAKNMIASTQVPKSVPKPVEAGPAGLPKSLTGDAQAMADRNQFMNGPSAVDNSTKAMLAKNYAQTTEGRRAAGLPSNIKQPVQAQQVASQPVKPTPSTGTAFTGKGMALDNPGAGAFGGAPKSAPSVASQPNPIKAPPMAGGVSTTATGLGSMKKLSQALKPSAAPDGDQTADEYERRKHRVRQIVGTIMGMGYGAFAGTLLGKEVLGQPVARSAGVGAAVGGLTGLGVGTAIGHLNRYTGEHRPHPIQIIIPNSTPGMAGRVEEALAKQALARQIHCIKQADKLESKRHLVEWLKQRLSKSTVEPTTMAAQTVNSSGAVT
jgi:hypothetical protein